MRFEGIDIPRGASVSEAFLTFTVGPASYCENVNELAASEVFMRAERTNAAGVLTSATASITARERTANSVSAGGASLM